MWFACVLLLATRLLAGRTEPGGDASPDTDTAATVVSGQSVVACPEAHLHVDETVTVEGIVLQTNRSNAGRVFLDFNDDPKAPDAFGLVIDLKTGTTSRSIQRAATWVGACG